MYDTAIYFEVNLMCVFMLFYVLVKIKESDRHSARIAFSRLIAATIINLLLDVAWDIVEKIGGRFIIVPNYIINMLYLFNSGFIGYLWLIYVVIKIDWTPFMSKKAMMILSLPIAVLFVFAAIAPVTGSLFYIDADGIYHRGTFYFVQVVVSYLYLIIASIIVLYDYVNTENLQKRSEYMTLFSFFILPVAGGVLAVIFKGLPMLWPMTAVSELMIFINMQNYQISTDGLTALNNRRNFDKFLAQAIEDEENSDDLYLMIMDVNGFKKINDTYGHIEGDNALRQTAEMLTDVCGEEDTFIARYGGDEFAVVLYSGTGEHADRMAKHVEDAFTEHNRKEDITFPITLSIGLAKYHEGETVEELIKDADTKLYEAKRAFKQLSEV